MINNNSLKALKLASKSSKTSVNWFYQRIVKISYNAKRLFLDMQKFSKTLQIL
jgi:hypothetical protein